VSGILFNLAWNISAVALASGAIYLSGHYPIRSVAMAFGSGILVALAGRFDCAVTREADND
jgi:hypothetical protein